MKLIFLHGWPGVGKLTVARELAQLTGFPVFHNHLTVDLLEPVFAFGSPPFVELRERIWLAVFARAAEERLPGLIFTFVFERTVREQFPAETIATIEARGGEVLFVELRCQQDELERRLVNPERARYSKLRSLETLRELSAAGVFVSPALPRANLIIDNTSLSQQETAQEITRRLGLTAAG